MKVYTFDIDLETVEISNIRRQYRTDLCGYTMGDFHCGMPDLEYDRDVPTDFGNETDFVTKLAQEDFGE